MDKQIRKFKAVEHLIRVVATATNLSGFMAPVVMAGQIR